MDKEGFEPLWLFPTDSPAYSIMDGEGFEPLWLFPIDSPAHSLMDGEGFEPSKAVPTDLQSAPFGHSGTHPYKPMIGLEPITC